VRLIYFDEVKYKIGSQPYYWLGALSLDESLVPEIEQAVSALALECFGSSLLNVGTEFHAADMFHRKAIYKGWSDTADRIEKMERLIKIFDRPNEIRKIEVRIDPAKMVAGGVEQKAFMFLVEKCQVDMQSLSGRGLLIGDSDGEISNSRIVDLSGYRVTGTPYKFGKPIENLIDTVYFAHSHHSRMLQIADFYVFCLQLCASPDANDGYARKRLKKFIRENTNLLVPNRYKYWPTEDTWYTFV
jgi:hypothetical protein